MKLVNSDLMREEDKNATEIYGIPSIILMENAGLRSADIIHKKYDVSGKKVIIVCGKGNNGGDGLVIARQLLKFNAQVVVYSLFDENNMTDSAKVNYEIVKKLGITVVKSADFTEFDLIIDCILGVGISGNVRDEIADVICEINASKKPVVAIDIPSGIDACSGRICGEAVLAHMTVTMGYGKIGLYTGAGVLYAGQVVVADISLPQNNDCTYNLTDHELLDKWVPKLDKLANKGSNGMVFVVAGSVGMTGAAQLTCMGALRSGAGIVKLAVPENLNSIMETKLTEAITVPLACENYLDEASAEEILEKSTGADVFIIGPGIGRNEQTAKAVHKIIRNTNIPLLIDADGIYAVSLNIDVLKEAKVPVIMTPHPGEFSRLIGKTPEEINDNRVAEAVDFSCKYGVTLLLKGAGTVVAMPDGEVYINPTGNEGMAKGGSGDVLAGIIGALWARGTENPAAAGAFIHGCAGDRAAEGKGKTQMLPTDLIKYI